MFISMWAINMELDMVRQGHMLLFPEKKDGGQLFLINKFIIVFFKKIG